MPQEQEISYSAGGICTGTTTLENNLAISKKLKRNKSLDAEISFLDIYPEAMVVNANSTLELSGGALKYTDALFPPPVIRI